MIATSAEWDPNNICMSLTSLVGGLVMLLGESTSERASPLHRCACGRLHGRLLHALSDEKKAHQESAPVAGQPAGSLPTSAYLPQ